MTPFLSRSLRSFMHRQDGAMIIIGLFLFVGMLFTASLALDMARYEQERARVQGVADRAVLAAANIRRDGDGAITPEEFLRGYFLAEGFTPQELDEWTVITGDGITGRSVTVRPAANLSTMLMSLIGVDDLPLVAPARAEVGASMQMEVVMVLDISGSMGTRTSNGQTRLANLKTAATTMVSDLMEDRRVGDVAISIAPYESWVVPTAGLLNTFPNASGSGACADFLDWADIDDFRGNGNNAFAKLRGQDRANAVRNANSTRMQRVNCGSATGPRVVQMLMTDEDAINAKINALSTMGTTSIDLGVRFGAMLFDEDLRPFVNSEIDAQRIHESQRNRPAGVDTPGVMRVMILMTDGQNCCGARGTVAQLDRNTQAVCDNLKAEGVIVYSVAFEAPTSGVNLMSYCASSDGHFFNTNGAGLSEAFQAIGRQINAQSLRLTL